MNRIWFALVSAVLVCSTAYATEYSKVEVRGTINDEETNLQDTGLDVSYFTSRARQSEKVTLPSATFTAFTWPASADAAIVIFNRANNPSGLKLKGVTGDTGISIDSAVPLVIGLSADGANVNFGILNEKPSSDSCRIFYF